MVHTFYLKLKNEREHILLLLLHMVIDVGSLRWCVCVCSCTCANVCVISRFFGGFFMDIKRKAPHYLSDYTDALSLQCLASFLFLYCACMSPVITFGGLLGEATEGRIVRHTAHTT